MQRCPPWLACLAWVALGTACARPVLEEDTPDALASTGGAPDADVPEPVSDAGAETDSAVPPIDTGEPDAGCTDQDQDTVCDAEDNCPGAPNTAQGDADDDGVGDVCESSEQDAAVPCNLDPVPASVMAGEATLSDVRVNGSPSPVRVSKGQNLSVSMHYAFAACGSLPIPEPRSIVLGFEGESSGKCELLIEVPCPQAVSASRSFTLQAPSRAGPAYIMAIGRQMFSCSDSLSGAVRVAALCVE
jgi:hypothetical protein